MEDIKRILIKRALDEHSDIYPCGYRATLEDCFTVNNGFLLFWFNDKDQNTRVMAEEL